MRPELRERIVQYNQRLARQAAQAEDLKVLAAALSRLPAGQLKKLLGEEAAAVLARYGPGRE